MIPCPNCAAPTLTKPLRLNGAVVPVDVEACSACRLFWFDRGASVTLTAQSVIDLFRLIGAVADAQRGPPLATSFCCPRCEKPLAPIHDVQRTTRFTYWRCEWDRGQLMSFQQFLRAKNFIRTPTMAEIAKLRETVQQVSCSQCGAPIDLGKDSACAHCGAPIALVDPDGVAKALQALANAPKPGAADPRDVQAALAAAPVLAVAKFEAERERERLLGRDGEPGYGTGYDLVAIGISAVADWLATQLTV